MLAPGTVALVGAGPGDPDLLTLAGRSLLEQADVVVYDALCNPRLLAHAPGARHVYVGKRAAHHAMPQEAINDLLLREARAEARVVRLKGGDPFVFGRGGEEAEALAGAGVPFVVVPGVTAAVAAGAFAGIPATHRDLNTSITFVTGHERERALQEPEAAARSRDGGAAAGATDWSALARLPALAFYMGVRSLPRISAKLISAGMDPATPAAIVQSGTLPLQRTVVATLGTIAEAAQREGISAPAITYVGRIVEMRQRLRWFDDPSRYPLLGKTILVTRARPQAGELSARLEALGANVLEAPTIRIEPPSDPGAVEAALRRQREAPFDWVIFTSVNGVEKTRQAMARARLDARDLLGRIAAVGPATAEACRRVLCIEPDLVPQRFDADALVEAIEQAEGGLRGRDVLLLRADIGRRALADALRARGAGRVEDVAVYETRPVEALPPHVLEAIDAGSVDAACFTSASTARNLAALLGDVSRLAGAKRFSIGPQTSAAMAACGMRVDAQAARATLDALVQVVRAGVGRG